MKTDLETTISLPVIAIWPPIQRSCVVASYGHRFTRRAMRAFIATPFYMRNRGERFLRASTRKRGDEKQHANNCNSGGKHANDVCACLHADARAREEKTAEQRNGKCRAYQSRRVSTREPRGLEDYGWRGSTASDIRNARLVARKNAQAARDLVLRHPDQTAPFD